MKFVGEQHQLVGKNSWYIREILNTLKREAL